MTSLVKKSNYLTLGKARIIAQDSEPVPVDLETNNNKSYDESLFSLSTARPTSKARQLKPLTTNEPDRPQTPETQSTKFFERLQEDYNTKLEKNYNWFGLTAFYRGIFPPDAEAKFRLVEDLETVGDH
jgi:hypothetical protein